MHIYMQEIHAVKWADFAGSGCLEFGFLDTIRKTRPSPVTYVWYSLKSDYWEGEKVIPLL